MRKKSKDIIIWCNSIKQITVRKIIMYYNTNYRFEMNANQFNLIKKYQ